MRDSNTQRARCERVGTDAIQQLRSRDMPRALGARRIPLAQVLDRMLQSQTDEVIGPTVVPCVFLADLSDDFGEIGILHGPMFARLAHAAASRNPRAKPNAVELRMRVIANDYYLEISLWVVKVLRK